MSESNRVQVSYGKEVTWDTIPAIAFDEVRRTGGAFNLVTNSTESQEVRSDRMVADVIRTGTESNGSIDLELSYAGHTALLEGAMASTFSAVESNTGTFSATAGAGATFTMTGAFTNLNAGDWFRVAGSTSNDGYWKIETKTDNDNVDIPSWQSGTSETSTASVTIDNDGTLRNGTTESSFTFQEGFLDHPTNPTWIAFSGCRVGTLGVNVAVDSILTGNFGLMGATVASQSAASPGYATGSINAAPTNPVMNAIDNIKQINVDDGSATLDISQISLSLDNSLRVNRAVGSTAPIAIRYGTFRLTGNFTAYFDTPDLLALYTGFTTTRLSFLVEEAAAGNTYVFDIPSIKITGDLPDPGGLDTDVMIPLNFTSFKDATHGFQFSITRFANS